MNTFNPDNHKVVPQSFVLGVTGHRPEGLFPSGVDPYSYQSRDALTDFAAFHLAAVALAAAEEGRKLRGVVTGMAQGWDQAIASACVRLEIPFMAAVPFTGQEGKWPKLAQKRYHDLLDLAAGVCVVSPGRFTSRSMFVRNEYIVNKSHAMLALYDGDVALVAGQRGGTASCLKYATRMRLPILNVWDDWTASRPTSRP